MSGFGRADSLSPLLRTRAIWAIRPAVLGLFVGGAPRLRQSRPRKGKPDHAWTRRISPLAHDGVARSC